MSAQSSSAKKPSLSVVAPSSSTSKPSTELDIVKRALRNGGAFTVFSLCVNGLWTDNETRKRVQIEGIATEEGVTLFAANILGSNQIFFVDELLSKSVCKLINDRMTEQLEDSLQARLAA